MRVPILILLLGLISAGFLPLTGCDQNPSSSTPAKGPVAADFSVYTYEVINTYPHDPGAFTQGLVFLDGALWESTGLNGQSSLRKVNLTTGEILQRTEVSALYFAEGLAILGDKIFQITWQNHKAFVYNRASFKQEKEFAYEGEGWGLTTDGQSLILSDGTDQIRFLDPATFAVQRTLRVTARGQPLDRLNELEYIKGEIFANIWGADFVVRIDPATGRVTGVMDFTGLLPSTERNRETDVLNGIAYDAAGDRLFITGKRWPKLFEVRLKPKL